MLSLAHRTSAVSTGGSKSFSTPIAQERNMRKLIIATVLILFTGLSAS